MALKYSKKVIEHFTKPQNVGEIEYADATATEGSPACGDMIKYTLKINPETKVVEDIKFLSFGCASNIATASMMTLLAKGKTTAEIKAMKHKELTQSLDGFPAIKMHCSVLAVDALKMAGVDLTTPQAVEVTFNVLSGMVDQLEQLTGYETRPSA